MRARCPSARARRGGSLRDRVHEDARVRRSRSLSGLYGPGKPRAETYKEMVDALLAPVRAALDVCAVFYGHAVDPPRRQRLRDEVEHLVGPFDRGGCFRRHLLPQLVKKLEISPPFRS
jgi:hypothetical protein